MVRNPIPFSQGYLIKRSKASDTYVEILLRMKEVYPFGTRLLTARQQGHSAFNHTRKKKCIFFHDLLILVIEHGLSAVHCAVLVILI